MIENEEIDVSEHKSRDFIYSSKLQGTWIDDQIICPAGPDVVAISVQQIFIFTYHHNHH